MKILFLNLNILVDIRYDSGESHRESGPLKAELLGKNKQKQHEGYCKDFYCLLARSSKIRNLK